MQAIDQRVRAFEPAGTFHIRMANNRLDITLMQFTGPICNFSIAESVECEKWLPGFTAGTFQDIAVGRLCGPQSAGAQFAILKYFRMA